MFFYCTGYVVTLMHACNALHTIKYVGVNPRDVHVPGNIKLPFQKIKRGSCTHGSTITRKIILPVLITSIRVPITTLLQYTFPKNVLSINKLT